MTWRRQRSNGKTPKQSKSNKQEDKKHRQYAASFDEESGFSSDDYDDWSIESDDVTNGGVDLTKRLRNLTTSFRVGASLLQRPPTGWARMGSLFVGLLLVCFIASSWSEDPDGNLATDLGGWLESYLPLEDMSIFGHRSLFSHSNNKKKSRMNNRPCDPFTSEIHQEIVIDVAKVKSLGKERLKKLRDFTEQMAYAKRMVNSPGREHYRLLQYLTQQYGDCRHVVDVGTGSVASALALGAGGVRVETFDLPQGLKERKMAFRGKSEEEWYAGVVDAGVKIDFHNLHLMQLPRDQFIQHMNSTWLIFIDTIHLPYSNPFERELFNRLMDIDYKGMVILDEIHGAGTFGGETERWWYELQDHAEERGYSYFDVSDVGHFTGTGIIDFSGKVKKIEEKKTKKGWF